MKNNKKSFLKTNIKIIVKKIYRNSVSQLHELIQSMQGDRHQRATVSDTFVSMTYPSMLTASKSPPTQQAFTPHVQSLQLSHLFWNAGACLILCRHGRHLVVEDKYKFQLLNSTFLVDLLNDKVIRIKHGFQHKHRCTEHWFMQKSFCITRGNTCSLLRKNLKKHTKKRTDILCGGDTDITGRFRACPSPIEQRYAISSRENRCGRKIRDCVVQEPAHKASKVSQAYIDVTNQPTRSLYSE